MRFPAWAVTGNKVQGPDAHLMADIKCAYRGTMLAILRDSKPLQNNAQVLTKESDMSSTKQIPGPQKNQALFSQVKTQSKHFRSGLVVHDFFRQ